MLTGRRPASMTRPLSNDLRERVVSAVLGGASSRQAAARFDVAVVSVVKLRQRYRATGSVAPAKMGGHRKRVLVPHRDFIQERLKQTPHLSLHPLKAELAARGVSVSHNAVWVFLRREGLRFKKNDARSRTSASGRGEAPAALESAAGKFGSKKARLHRRN